MPRWVIQAGSRVVQFPDHFTAQQVTAAMESLYEYSDSQPRDDHGRWSDTGGGQPPLHAPGPHGIIGGRVAARFHREADFLDTSPGSRQNPIYCGKDIERAAQLIAEGKHVTLNQPDQISTLVDKIKSESEAAKAAGRPTPNWNLAAISVKGTNLFAQQNVGIPRVEMPQVAGRVDTGSPAWERLPAAQRNDPLAEVDLTKEFIASLKERGVQVTEREVMAPHLRGTQAELDGSKVAQISTRMAAGTLPPGKVFITRDNYVLDGHHRWAAAIVNDARDNHVGDFKLPVVKLNVDIGTALTWARDFQKE